MDTQSYLPYGESFTDPGLCSTAVGLIMGFLFGTSSTNATFPETERVLRQTKGGFNIMRYGAGPSGPMRTLGQYMLGSGVTFGYVGFGACTSRHLAQHPESNLVLIAILFDSFFMSIGTVIRTEGNSASATEAFARARRQPMVLPRKHARIPE